MFIKIDNYTELSIRIKESIEKATQVLGLDNFENEECEVDYSHFCPEGWIYLGNGKDCKVGPGVNYEGSCPHVMDFSGKTPLDKFNLSRTCKLKWPCKKDFKNVPDRDDICPQYWLYSDGYCQPTEYYTGPCSQRLRLVGKTMEERKAIAKECNLVWSLKVELLNPKFNFDVPCPLGWSEQPNSNKEVIQCKLDKGQSSPCMNFLNFKSKEDKKTATLRCGLIWPFLNRDFGGSIDSCPHGWILDQRAEGNGPCQLRIEQSIFKRIPKSLWSVICAIDLISLDIDNSNKTTKSETRPFKMTRTIYDDGPIEETFRIIKKRRINPNSLNATIVANQLSKLEKLKSQTSDPNFISTLNFTINGLKRRIGAFKFPSFLQISSQVVYEQCPSPETYTKVVPNCPYVVKIEDFKELESQGNCRVTTQQYCIEDFTRYACPVGWKRRRYEYDDVLRTLCIAPPSFTKRGQCGSKVDFTDSTAQFKKQWAYACNVHFPCYNPNCTEACVENFFWFVYYNKI
ncbi:CPW-WPC domain [Babesia duncani]|uniref:CPW-WPC domain n=1 Tax=Babesia duncani TaxID=323732 RepID=A0AAD9PHK7_9APIC|nr:CPW-WPC domain [Babesia duncani]